MIRVLLEEISPSRNKISRLVELPAAPRQGEQLVLEPGDSSYTIHTVFWCAFEHREYDVIVRFR